MTGSDRYAAAQPIFVTGFPEPVESQRAPTAPGQLSSRCLTDPGGDQIGQMKEKLEILLLCDFNEGSAGTIVDHVRAFPEYSRHRFWILSNRGDLPIGLELERFDGIVLHYSIIISYDSYLSPLARGAIRRFGGFKAVYVQDDYRWIDRTVAAMQYLRVNAIFGLAPREVIDEVYSPSRLPDVDRNTVLAGYVPEHLTQIAPKAFADRRIDVGYRARKLPAWIGTHAQEKWQIADRFMQDAPMHDLKCDVSYREEDRIYADAWVDFIRDCKAVLGTESGFQRLRFYRRDSGKR
ncbi:MAG: hypothetical protein HC807_03030 [Gammaproteobacteria bacterium]|nr:hypothetical protein [Gammaproteobacteria bacterium]